MDLHTLIDRLPSGTVLTDPGLLAGYRQDWAKDPDAATPAAVVRARSTSDVSETLRWATEHRVAVVPRGAGSGLSGGATGLDGGIVVCTERMREIRIDPATRTAVVQPGLLNAEVKRAVAEHGLWYPPDPSSLEICSIGGNAATNAGGLCCVKYGVTTDYVLGMEVVLADGTAVRLGGPRLKDSAGLPLTKLFVGSEGTLGIITELTLRLLPAQAAQSTVVASFTDLTAATEAVLAINGALCPAMLEFMDSVAINAVEDELRMGLDRAAAALLIARSDAPGEHAAYEARIMLEACRAAGATEAFDTAGPEEGEAFTAARRFAIPAVERLGKLLLEDVGVPLPRLGDLVTGVAEIARRNDVTVSVIAHAGDGNTHPLIVHDPTDPAETARAHRAFGEIMELAIALDGTITGEHGVGRLKKAWLPDQLGPDVMALTRRIKDALDPHGILNPGALLSAANRSAIRRGTNSAPAAVPPQMSTELRHNTADTRFEIYLDGDLAGYADYAETGSPKVRNFHHTMTFPEFRGRGVAGQVVRYALDESRADGYSVLASCWYVDEYIGRHPEYADLVHR